MLSILVIMKVLSSNGYKIQYLDKESVLGYVVENVLSKLWATFKPPFLNDLEWHRFNDRVLYQSAFVLPCLPFYASLFSNLMSKNVTLLLPTFLYITRAVVVEIIEPSGFNKEVKDVHVLTVLVWNIWACSGMELAVTNIRDSISARGHDVSDGY